MYQTVTSTPTDRADSMVVEPGLIRAFAPVLCCPDVLAAPGSVAYELVHSDVVGSYRLTTGLSAASAAVPDNASVEALIGARRVA